MGQVRVVSEVRWKIVARPRALEGRAVPIG